MIRQDPFDLAQLLRAEADTRERIRFYALGIHTRIAPGSLFAQA